MTLRPLVLCVALAAAAACASLLLAEQAHAHSLNGLVPHGSQAYHGGVGVGFGVTVPVGPRRRPVRGPYGSRGGYWTVQQERVWHPPELIGYDAHGHPVYSDGHWDVQPVRVWVPGPRRGHVRGYGRGYARGQGRPYGGGRVTFGVGFRR